MSHDIKIDSIHHYPPDPRPGQRVRLVLRAGKHKAEADYTAGTPGEGSQHHAMQECLKRLMKAQGKTTPEQRGHTIKENTR